MSLSLISRREEQAKLRKAISKFQQTAGADARAPDRVKAVNTLLNSCHLWIVSEDDIESLWEALFFALWSAEMGRGCEEIIASIERACANNCKLTRTGLLTVSKHWYGLDQYRIDKVSHLARHLLTVVIEQQIRLWLKSLKNQKSGSQNVCCKQLLRKVFRRIVNSYGLCYFLLEILADEISRALTKTYERLHATVGRFNLKANLIIFLYKQVISFAADLKLDSRLLRTFDQYVIKKFIVEILPNESQLTQILVTLRLYQALDKQIKRADGSERAENQPELSGKCRALFKRWSEIIQDIHEKSIDGQFFPINTLPVKGTIELTPQIE